MQNNDATLPITLHSNDHERHVLLDGNYHGQWFTHTVAAFAKDQVAIHQVASGGQQQSVYLSQDAMESLLEVWQKGPPLWGRPLAVEESEQLAAPRSTQDTIRNMASEEREGNL